MLLRRWEPLREMATMREAMDRLFDDGLAHPVRRWSGHRTGWDNLGLDVYHTPESLVIKATVPGVKPEDVEVTVTGNTLAISGQARTDEEVKEESYIVRERRSGSFSRTLRLPTGLKTDEMEAAYEDGILTLTISKVEEARPRAIKVEVKRPVEGKKAA